MPVHVARGKGSCEGKAEFADIKSGVLNLILNGTISAGSLIVAEPVNTVVPSATTYTITITVPASGTFGKLRVVYDVSGNTKVPMKLTTGTPTTGQYSFDSSTKTITFAAADADKKVQYQYDYTVTTGKTITLKNNIMGTAPTFELEMYATLDDTPIVLVLNKCTTDSLGMNFKNEDYQIPSFGFEAFADAADVVGYVYLAE
jgi:hypothetical protein